MTTTADVARIARAAGEAGDRGEGHLKIEHVEFDLDATGWCARFVRQVHEAALGLPPFGWPWSSDTARHMEDKLVANHKRTDEPVPGDIIAMNRGTGRRGHIGIWLGDGLLAENTSSIPRNPGTSISKLSEIAHEVSGYYRVLPTPDDPSPWAAVSVAKAKARGIMAGTRPHDAVTREELAVVLDRIGALD